MNQEDKQQLLLKDLCSRLPYGVILQVGILENGDMKYHKEKLDCHSNLLNVIKLKDGYYFKGILCKYSQFTVKPYLRPMSSMTEEEKSKFYDICTTLAEDKCHFIMEGFIDSNFMLEKFSYLDSIHVDYRGLIPKGLAIEVTKGNNPYELSIKSD